MRNACAICSEVYHTIAQMAKKSADRLIHLHSGEGMDEDDRSDDRAKKLSTNDNIVLCFVSDDGYFHNIVRIVKINKTSSTRTSEVRSLLLDENGYPEEGNYQIFVEWYHGNKDDPGNPIMGSDNKPRFVCMGNSVVIQQVPTLFWSVGPVYFISGCAIICLTQNRSNYCP